MTTVYTPMAAKLINIIEETPTIKTFVLRPEEPIDFRAGQFVQLTVPGVGEAPFTPSSSPLEKEHLDITILRTGRVTDILHEMSAGETLGVRGPFGKGYPIDELPGKEVLVVGGGVGLAPLRALLYTLFADDKKCKRVSIKYGARKPEELLYQRLYDEWAKIDNVDVTVTIDVPAPGWTGHVGLVTTLLENLDVDIANTVAFSCGPEIMLKFVTYALIDKGFTPSQIYLSMNRKMSCGIGKCGKCNIGPYYLCKDGPDICYEKVKDYPDVF